ncbi:MAG: hypothetical protein QOG68_1056 [Solirubrobacteraceae bacterium]|nr:hypothetical protein [Solirubrobacteraceae bacterium]
MPGHNKAPGSAAELPAERLMMARALAFLFFAGATIGAISLVLPHNAAADDLGLWSNVVIAYLGAAGILLWGPRLPIRAFHVVLAGGSLIITRAILLSHDPVSFYSVWFIWVGLYSFYFFGRLQATLHVSFIAILYGATLVAQPAGSSVARWLTTLATLLVAGGFLDTLVRRARHQAEVAASSASSLERFAAASHDLAEISDPVAARQALCRTAADVTGARHVELWEPAADQVALEVTASAGTPGALAGLSFAADAITSAQPVKTATSLWQPVFRDSGAAAVLALHWDASLASAGDTLGSLGSLLAAETLITLNRLELLARLDTMARTDELTGLPNRRAWEEQAPREVERARREQAPLCIALIDLDRFKAYNDAQGHQAGDRLLKHAAAAWQQELRTTDLLARYGGEEFALILAGCEGEQALATLERIRRATPEGQACSAGLACWDGIESAFDLFGRADVALYEAKRAGRDRSVVASAPA